MNTTRFSPQPPASARTREAGFTLMELLIVMSVMLILMTLAIPFMQQASRKANQTSAVASIHNIVDMEGQYNSEYHTYACTLPALGGKQGSGPPTAESAQLIAEDLAAGNKSGYTFTPTCGDKVTVANHDQYNSFTVTAVPNAVGKSGNLGYCADGNSQIHYDPKGGTNCTDILQ